MYQAKVTFTTPHKPTADDVELVTDLLICWHTNGQVLSAQWCLTAQRRALVAHLSIPEMDALDSRHSNKYGRRSETKLIRKLGYAPVVKVLGEALNTLPACLCAERRDLILFTNFLSFDPPVRCALCFDPVPLYHLHPSDEDDDGRRGILVWAGNYNACDHLQIGCTVGERFGETQMGELDSALTRLGRETALALSDRGRVRVYYYLYKGRATSEKRDRNRRCPQCQGEWLLPTPWHDLFDFRCDTCLLVSNIAWSVRNR